MELMKEDAIRRVVNEIAKRNYPIKATIDEVEDQIERRHNLAEGMFHVKAMTGRTWKQIFDKMPELLYDDKKKEYEVVDVDALQKMSLHKKKEKSKKKKRNTIKKVEKERNTMENNVEDSNAKNREEKPIEKEVRGEEDNHANKDNEHETMVADIEEIGQDENNKDIV